MLKKLSSFTILALIQSFVLVLAVLYFAPYIMDSISLRNSITHFLQSSQVTMGIVRLICYGVLFLLWPRLTQLSSMELNEEQLKTFSKGRYPLIGALFLLELIYWAGR